MMFCNVKIPDRLFELTRARLRRDASFSINEVRQQLLAETRADLVTISSIERNWPLIINRVLRACIGELEDAGEIGHIQRGVWARA
ncbi:hypothetical protein G3A43_07810 [Paraburkholderia aspalathi]|nr:hypothetical protein [Paraburkholderia aspalathi]MBK3780161.1 hypothetical protein [Paraburkholderia aspalathi]